MQNSMDFTMTQDLIFK